MDAHFEERYLQTEVSQFVLHGNVHDLVNCAGQSWAMGDFLGQFFEPSGKLVVHYDQVVAFGLNPKSMPSAPPKYG